MRSIFLKIFLSYWLALALFIVLTILATLALRPQREFSSFELLQPKILNDAIQAYQTGGPNGAREYLRNFHDTQRIRAYLFNQQGQEVTGRIVPERVARVQRGEVHTADTIWGRIRRFQFLRLTTVANDGQRYTLVMELPPGQSLFGPRGLPGLGITIAILSSGLVCFFLARYLTSPVVRLRVATQKLAAGDLSARAGSANYRRRDEMAELVRDFDAMAVRLEMLVKAQSRLLSDISHELRSPLARLNVAVALVRQRTGAEVQGALDRVEREAERLNELIGRLLTIARLESGNDGLQRFATDLGELTAEIVKDADFEAQSRHCSVKMTSSEECIVLGDPSLLHSAIENVIRNAARYTRENTTVHVSLARQAGAGREEAVIQVSDCGPGVPEESLDKMFRPFYRVDDARGRRTGGVGLGLAITQRAVHLHGGTVTASNRPEGGLLVEIRLPVLPSGKGSTEVGETAAAIEHSV